MSNTSSVTLGDVTITEDDVRLLRPPNWLNDQLLSLWVELLRRKGKQLGTDVDDNDNIDIALIPPNLAFFIMLAGEDDVENALKSLKLHAKRRVVLFINDSTGNSHGTHWSVLCYDRASDQFRTYDSGGDMNLNRAAARKMANVLVKHLGTSRATVTFRHVEIPHQLNSYSCGDFSCATAQKLCDAAVEPKDGESLEIDFKDLRELADTVRPKLRAAIDELRGDSGKKKEGDGEKEKETIDEVSSDIDININIGDGAKEGYKGAASVNKM